MKLFAEWRNELARIIAAACFTDCNGAVLSQEDGATVLLKLAITAMVNQKRLYFIGNGASASMASHIAADMGKNGRLKTDVFTDLALLTAIVNDLGGENIFAAPLMTQAQTGDKLIVISSSGNSPNLVNAVEVARKIGLSVATFTAMSASNQLRQLGDINVWVPAPEYGLAESAHASILHYWVDNVVEQLNEGHQ